MRTAPSSAPRCWSQSACARRVAASLGGGLVEFLVALPVLAGDAFARLGRGGIEHALILGVLLRDGIGDGLLHRGFAREPLLFCLLCRFAAAAQAHDQEQRDDSTDAAFGMIATLSKQRVLARIGSAS